MTSDSSRISVCITSSRESPEVLSRTLQATIRASSQGSTVDIIINGSSDLKGMNPRDYSNMAHNSQGVFVRFWGVDLPDKANAINIYLRHIVIHNDVIFFIDGYVRPHHDAFRLLSSELLKNSFCVGATGLPHIGREAEFIRKDTINNGGIHGNMFALKGSTAKNILDCGFLLPLGIYRVDSTIGSFLNYNLDPKRFDWDHKRIAVVADATWDIDKKYWWRIRDILDTYKRRSRQAQGDFENKAIRYFFKNRPKLPASASELIREWSAAEPHEVLALCNKSRLHRKFFSRINNLIALEESKPYLIFQTS